MEIGAKGNQKSVAETLVANMRKLMTEILFREYLTLKKAYHLSQRLGLI